MKNTEARLWLCHDAQKHGGAALELHVAFLEVQREFADRFALSHARDRGAIQVVDSARIGRKNPKRLSALIGNRPIAATSGIGPDIRQHSTSHPSSDSLFGAISHSATVAEANVTANLHCICPSGWRAPIGTGTRRLGGPDGFVRGHGTKVGHYSKGFLLRFDLIELQRNFCSGSIFVLGHGDDRAFYPRLG